MRVPTGRERRTLIIGMCIAIPAVLFRASAPYRATLADTREQLEVQRDLLGRELALLRDLERYPAAYRSADSAMTRIGPRLFDEPDDVLATSSLTSYIAGQALTSHVLFQEAASRPAQRTKDGIRTLQIEVRAEGDMEGVMRFLQALERGPKLITVEDLSISRSERVQEKGRAPITVLSLTATINGYALADSALSESGTAAPEPDR